MQNTVKSALKMCHPQTQPILQILNFSVTIKAYSFRDLCVKVRNENLKNLLILGGDNPSFTIQNFIQL